MDELLKYGLSVFITFVGLLGGVLGLVYIAGLLFQKIKNDFITLCLLFLFAGLILSVIVMAVVFIWSI